MCTSCTVLVKGLPLELCDQYQISPQMLWQANISLGNMILTAITSRPDRKIYAERCDNSGVRLLQLLYAKCDNLNGSSQNLIVHKMAKVTHAGTECATTAGFADDRETMGALNNSLGLKKRLNEDTLTANYESALNRAGLQEDFDLKVIQ